MQLAASHLLPYGSKGREGGRCMGRATLPLVLQAHPERSDTSLYRILLTLLGGAKVVVAKCYYWVFAAFFSPPPPTKRLMGLDGIM